MPNLRGTLALIAASSVYSPAFSQVFEEMSASQLLLFLTHQSSLKFHQPVLSTAMRSPEFNAQYGLGNIGADVAFAGGFVGRDVPIAVFDSALDTTHPELSGRIGGTYNMFTGDPIDTADGRHGTQVSSIIVANQDDAGMMGVAPGARLFAVALLKNRRVSSSELEGLSSAAFDFVLANDVVAINHSWGNNMPITTPGIKEAIIEVFPNFMESLHKTAEAGVINVWATGNASQTESSFHSGLPYLFPELEATWIAVTSLDKDGKKAESANECGVAANWCVAAPGVDILSATSGGGYISRSGTSYAAPHVTGAIAIAKEVFPNATGPQLRDLVLQTATDIGEPGVDPVFGWGSLNVGNIVRSSQPTTASLYATATWSGFSAMGQMQGSVPNTRLSGQRGPLNDIATRSQSLTEGANKSAISSRNFWVRSVIGQSRLNGGQAATGGRTDLVGIAMGVDFMATDTFRLGFAVGMSSSDLRGARIGDHANTEGRHLFGYGDWQSGSWFVSGIGQLAFLKQTITRVNIAGVGGASNPIGRSIVDVTGASLDVRAGHDWETSVMTISPYLGASAQWQSAGSFSEIGSGVFALSSSGSSSSQLSYSPGIEFRAGEVELGDARIQAGLDLSYARLVGDLDNATSVSLLGSRFDARTAEVGKDVFRISLRMNVTSKNERTKGYIAYYGQLQRNARSHQLTAGLRTEF